MKKLKLKMQELNSPEVLTRQRLKNVLGGTGGGGTTKDPRPKCAITAAEGYPDPGPYFYCTNTTPSECKAAATSWCSSTPGCSSVTCPGDVA